MKEPSQDTANQGPRSPGASTDPLHGITLKELLERLVDHYGWKELGSRIPIRCFNYDPSVKSSLTFLRKTPWARKKVETLFIKVKPKLDPRAD